MLEGLDEIDWDGLDHAYGAAGDVPALLRALASGHPKAASEAIDALFGNIYHQGTVYTASAPAVPFLVRALPALLPEHRAQVLGLLACLAQGRGYYDVHRHLAFAKKAMESGWVTDPEATLEEEREIVRKTTLAVFAQWDAIEAHLDAPERNVRLAALHTLSVLGQNDAAEPAPADVPAAYLGVRPDGPPGAYAARLRARADRALAAPSQPVERAAWLRALLQMDALDHPALAQDRAAAGSALERFVAIWARALAELRDAPALPASFGPLLSGVEDRRAEMRSQLEGADWPWEDWPDIRLLELFSLLPEPALEAAAPACARLLVDARGLVFHSDLALRLVLGELKPSIPDDPCLLPPGRQAIARAFLAKPLRPDPWWFWAEGNGNAAAACARAGVPHDRAAWLQWLGLPEDGGAWWRKLWRP